MIKSLQSIEEGSGATISAAIERMSAELIASGRNPGIRFQEGYFASPPTVNIVYVERADLFLVVVTADLGTRMQ